MSRNRHGLPRHIPEPIKRAVRQRDGFGCVVCGSAFFQYDHFNPEYDEAVDHSVDGIALLCWHHHGQKETGVLDEETYRAARAAPRALAQGSASTQWSLADRGRTLEIGSTLLEGTSSLLAIDGQLHIGFAFCPDSHRPLLYLAVYDRDGKPCAAIVDNEIVLNPDAFDIKATKGVWEIRSAMGQLDFRVEFSPPVGVVDGHMKRDPADS